MNVGISNYLVEKIIGSPTLKGFYSIYDTQYILDDMSREWYSILEELNDKS